MNDSQHISLNRFEDHQNLMIVLNQPVQRDIILLFTILNRIIFNPVRFSIENKKKFDLIIEQINAEDIIKENLLFDTDFVEDLVKSGLLSNVQSMEKFHFKGLQEKMLLSKGLKIFHENNGISVGLTTEAIEKLIRFNFSKMEDLDIKKAIAKMRVIPCPSTNTQHDLFELINGYIVLSDEVMDLFQECTDCYLIYFIERLKNETYKKFNEMRLSIFGLLKIFGKEFIQESTLRRFAQLNLSEYTDFIRSLYVKNDTLVIKTRFQNPIRLNDTKIPISEWIENLNKLIYCYLDIQSYSSIFDFIIESVVKIKYASLYKINLRNIFESEQKLMDYMKEINKDDQFKTTFSEELSVFSNQNSCIIANSYENILKLIKIGLNIVVYLENKHNIVEIINGKEEYIALNKKVF